MGAGALPGAEVVKKVHDTDHGPHQCELRDHDDNRWPIGTCRGA